MYCSQTSLTPCLSPDAYRSQRHHDVEQRALFESSWHLVGTWKQLAKPGDFITTSLLGIPIQVRNFDGELRAFSNVCAHRHALLSSERCGSSLTMRCQYHGWEYGADGRTRRIPCAKEFVPLNREVHRLSSYRVSKCGQLVFVSLAEEGPDLAAQLGDFTELCEARFGERWCESLCWEPDYDANWKIPIENSLEAYHVPSIHPKTFRNYPGPERSTHVLLPHRTAFGTCLPFSVHSRIDNWFQAGEGWFMRRLGHPATGEYWQHHVFPNLLFSFTDAVSLCQCVISTGPHSSRAVIRQFGRDAANGSVVQRWLSRSWAYVAAKITKQILREDMHLFAAVQRGIESSSQPGLLGACEERIHAFQQFVAQRCALQDAPHSAAVTYSLKPALVPNSETPT